MSNNVSQPLPLSSVGEVSVEEKSPITQISSYLGLLDNVLTVSDNLASGSSLIENGLYVCNSGTDTNSFSTLLSKRFVSQKSGQGAEGIVSTIFDTPTIGNDQIAGLITNTDSLAFGYLGTAFGIAHVSGGRGELQELTLTVIASGAETASVTVSGVVYSVNLTGTGTLFGDAYEIVESLNTQVPNFDFSSNGSTVVAQGDLPIVAGSFAYSSASSVGAWVQITQSSGVTVAFEPQAAWNIDTRISSDPGINLNPLKGNTYRVQYKDAFGAIVFSLEDKSTGEMVDVHMIESANSTTIPNLSNTSLRVGWLTRNTGGTTNVALKGTSASLFIQGKRVRDTLPRALFNEQLAVGTSRTSVLTIRNRSSFSGNQNRAELYPLKVSISTQASKFALFEILVDPTFSEPINYEYVDKDNSIVEFSTDGVLTSGGMSGGALVAPPNQTIRSEFNLSDQTDTILFPGQVVCVVATNGSGGTADCQVTALFQEDL